MNKKVMCVIMGGGRGTRLYPLTKLRCKPAVPLGGKYRLVDISISNCLNSGYNRIYVLTQFNTASLHRHIQDSYHFDQFGGGFVDILSAEQTEASANWYQGTADAVRQNMQHFLAKDDDLFILLSGDQLYHMNLSKVVEDHLARDADVTIATTVISRDKAPSYGIMQVADDYSISDFVEKPKDNDTIDSLVISDTLKEHLEQSSEKNDYCLASMGIYVFKASVLKDAFASDSADFGKEIIPSLLNKVKVYSYIFEGYWEDIGTVEAFFNANLMLTDPLPKFNFFDPYNKVYTHAGFLPATKFNAAYIQQSIIAEGCIISGASLRRSVISVRSVIREGSQLDNVYMMGADLIETPARIQEAEAKGLPPIGIGRNCRISNAIIDKNARIGDNVVLSPKGKPDKYEEKDIYVRDGVLIVLKNGVIPSRAVIA